MEKKNECKTIGNQRVATGILLIVWIIAMVSFAVTPFTGDIKVFMASANQSNYISKNLIVGAYQAWELKSVFSRTFMYLIYKVAMIFVPFGTYPFEICCKIIYEIFMMAVVLLSVRLILDKEKFDVRYAVGVSLGFLCLHTGCQMQVEMTCSLLILLAFSLYCNAICSQKHSFLKLFVSGMLIGSTFYFKSVLILLSVSVVAAIGIYNIYYGKKLSIKRMLVVVFGSLSILIMNLFLIILINSDEIKDILNASAFQTTLISTGVNLCDIPGILMRFIYHFAKESLFMPVVIIGVLALIINFISNIRGKKYLSSFFHIILWIMPAIFIILSNMYFMYHFAVFLFPSVFEIYMCLLRKIQNTGIVLLVISGIALIFYLVNYSAFSKVTQEYIVCDKQSYKETNQFLESVDFDKSQNILYLDDGAGAYMLGNPSYLKYFYPLPLQRLEENTELECYHKCKSQVMDYTGRYISVNENWFFSGKNKDVEEKINGEYKLIGHYKSFSTPWIIHNGEINLVTYDLYERK